MTSAAPPLENDGVTHFQGLAVIPVQRAAIGHAIGREPDAIATAIQERHQIQAVAIPGASKST